MSPQLDLFDAPTPPPHGIATVPEWDVLPDRTRDEVLNRRAGLCLALAGRRTPLRLSGLAADGRVEWECMAGPGDFPEAEPAAVEAM
ncbi:MAG: hypothetical protein WC789_10445 [Lentisphaeria bacterium]